MRAWRASLSYDEPLAGVAVVLAAEGECAHGGARKWRGEAQRGTAREMEPGSGRTSRGRWGAVKAHGAN